MTATSVIAPVIARLGRGHRIHMQYAGGRRVWWFEEPREEVTDAVMQSVLRDGAVAEAGDSLFGLPLNS